MRLRNLLLVAGIAIALGIPTSSLALNFLITGGEDDPHEGGFPLPFTPADDLNGVDSGFLEIVSGGEAPTATVKFTYQGSDARFFNLFTLHGVEDPEAITDQWWNQDPSGPGGPGALPGIVAVPGVTMVTLELPVNTRIPFDFTIFPSGVAGGNPADVLALCNDPSAHMGCDSGEFSGVIGDTTYNMAHIFTAAVTSDSDLLTSEVNRLGRRAWIGLSDGGSLVGGEDNDGKDFVVLAEIVPEPSSLLLIGSGLIGFLALNRRTH